jgi:diguanylate cyclase (GGDEF)-like protein
VTTAARPPAESRALAAAPYRRLVTVVWSLAAALITVHAGWVWTGNGPGSPVRLWSPGAPFAVTLLLAAGVIAVRCVTVSQQRGAWACVATAVALNGLGYVVYDLVSRADRVPSASLADFFWALVLPLFTAGVWLLARARVGGIRMGVYVGAAAVALLVAAVYAATLGAQVLAWSADGLTDRLVNLYYPSADVVVIGSVAAVATLAGGRLGRAWGLMVAAVVLTVVGDAWLARLVAESGSGVERIDPLWSYAGLLVAAAAWQRPHRLTHQPMGLPELGIPPLCAALAVLMLVAVEFFGWVPAAAVLAAVAALLAIVRMVIGLRVLLDAAEFHRLAITDDLTDLYNRRGFLQGMEEALARKSPTAGVRAVLMLDLDRFKDINDGLGHQTGDSVLAAVATRLSGAAGPDDLVARLSGDEFGVLTTVPAGQPFEMVVERLRAAVRRPLLAGRIMLPIDVSIGVAVESDAAAGAPAVRALDLLRCADTAMYRAKAERVGWARYDVLGSDRQRDALELAGELRSLLSEVSMTPAVAGDLIATPGKADYGWLELHYQPLAAVTSDDEVRVEALVRWVHPRYGMVMPDRFVALAERIGLMPYLTRQVLSLALDQATRWRGAGAMATVSVNLAASDIASPTLMDEVLDGLRARGLPPEALTVEITEQTAIGDLDTGRDALAVLRQAGIGVAIDDFGTGYSALSYLQRLPATELKLDRSLTARVVDDQAAAAIVQACVDLAHTLGLEVVAEGVETQEQSEALVERGCDWLQGWLYGRPAPAGPLPPAVRFTPSAPGLESVTANI